VTQDSEAIVAALPLGKRLAFAAILAPLTLLLLAATGEAILRVFAPAPDRVRYEDKLAESARTEVTDVSKTRVFGMIQPASYPGGVYELKPNHHWSYQGVPIATNRFGCRAPEIADRPAPGVTRLLVLGDSVTFGWGVRAEETYAGRLQAALGASVEVVNCAEPGYNLPQEAERFAYLLPRLHPDLLLLGYTLNDHLPALFQPQRPSVLERSALFLLFRDLWSARRQQVSPDEEQRARLVGGFDRLTSLARSARVPVLMYIYPQPLGEAMVALPRGLGTERGIEYIDLYQALARGFGGRIHALSEVYLTPTDPHPNALGHALMAESLQPQIEAAIGRRTR
jgi:lysophospholipase L1-like esterase